MQSLIVLGFNYLYEGVGVGGGTSGILSLSLDFNSQVHLCVNLGGGLIFIVLGINYLYGERWGGGDLV